MSDPKATDHSCGNVETCDHDGSNTREKRARKLAPEGVK